MMTKLFQTATRPGGMVAWISDSNSMMLITHDYFHILVKELLADQGNELQLTKFAMRISHHMKVDNENKHTRLQQLLNHRLKDKMENDPVPIIEYSFHEDEARKHIEDFLEAYKFNEERISFALDMPDDESTEVFNIILRNKPKLIQKLKGQPGDPYDEINIKRSEIIHLQGMPSKFILDLKSGLKYLFGETGVHAQVI